MPPSVNPGSCFLSRWLFLLSLGCFVIGLSSLEALAKDLSKFEEYLQNQEKNPAESPTVATPEKAEPENNSVEINGDQVEYMMAGNKLVAQGNVSIVKGTTRLTGDKVVFSKDSKIAVAEGHVRLNSPQGTITGDKMTFNFGTMTGEFMGAKIASAPFYGEAKTMQKLGPKHIVLGEGYLTTCDLDKPHFRMASRKLDVFPGEKAVAQNVHMIIGRVPVFYLPRYTQRLDGKPRLTFVPGYSKEWGMFLLTSYRYELNPRLKGNLHLDFRERLDVGEGFDVEYHTPKTGNGIIKGYYTLQRRITSKHFYQPRPSPTPEQERYKFESRHKWDIDKQTQAVWQYYKLSGPTFLKDFFENEYRQESNPASFFVLNRTMPNGSLSFRTDVRINHFVSSVERLPEIKYDVANQQLWHSNFYLKTTDTFSNLVRKDASPTEVNKETVRMDSNNEISYPMKVSIVEFKPLVGGRTTYYSRTKDRQQYDIVRGIFTTGADLSTKFHKVYDLKKNFWGIAINRLRHIITPSIAYRFSPDPTVPASQLDEFDTIDTLAGDHTIGFSVENKLQTKRDNTGIELLRNIVSFPFRLKEYPTNKGGFDHITTQTDFKPIDWLTFSMDTDYNAVRDRLSTINFELYINDQDDKWYLALGKRLNVAVDDQITTELGYRLNPKWKFRVYERYDVERGLYKEHGYTITRNLHEWDMDMVFNEKRNEGEEILLIFRLKAFPESPIDIGTSFNRRKAGSQSTSTGL